MHPDDRPVEVAIVGAGNRGAEVYAAYGARHPEEVRVVGVADPRPERRDRLGREHGIAPERRYADARQLLAAPRFADGVVIATPDHLHVDPAIQALRAGYDVLLEKPLAPDAAGLRRLQAAASGRPEAVTVGHVLRYTPFFATIKGLLDDGAIGALQGIEHTENIGFWHFAHSYVRGNWRRSDLASPMILAKACHDLDLLRWLAGSACEDVASFGQRRHFHEGNAPEGAPTHCLDGCPVEDSCPYHAGRFYVDHLAGHDGWPVSVVTDDLSRPGRLEALRRGPYGRCVYRSDNDVVDHQVTILRFADGVSATLTVSAFTRNDTRTVRYLGSHGEIRGRLDAGEVEVHRFRPAPDVDHPSGADGDPPRAVAVASPPVEHLRIPADSGRPAAGRPSSAALAGHAGGDEGLMRDFVRRLRERRSGRGGEQARTSLAESIDSHLMAFAAEASRHRREVVRPGDLAT